MILVMMCLLSPVLLFLVSLNSYRYPALGAVSFAFCLLKRLKPGMYDFRLLKKPPPSVSSPPPFPSVFLNQRSLWPLPYWRALCRPAAPPPHCPGRVTRTDVHLGPRKAITLPETTNNTQRQIVSLITVFRGRTVCSLHPLSLPPLCLLAISPYMWPPFEILDNHLLCRGNCRRGDWNSSARCE